jgi:hypothetical protein
MDSPPASTLIDVIVMVFAKSEMKSLVGTDALRSVLEGQQRALFPEPDTLTLQPLYELLEDQPGFEAEKAVAPFCRLKTWESRLKIKVVMPVALEILDQNTRENKAMNVNAFDSDLDKLLRPPAKPTASLTRVIDSGNTEVKDSERTTSRVKIAAIAALVSLLAVGVSLYITFVKSANDGNTIRLSASDISDKIPLDNVRKSGDIIIATVSDSAWLDKPEFERRKDVEEVVVKLRIQESRTLMLVDTKGMTIGTVILRGAPIIYFVPRRS